MGPSPSFRRPSITPKTRAPRALPYLEPLEDRTVLDGTEWLMRLSGLPGATTAEQMHAAQLLLVAAQIPEEEVEVVDHATVDGFIVIETPDDLTEEELTEKLQDLPGFIDVQEFEDENETGDPDLGPADEGPSGATLNVGLVGNEPTIAVNPLNPNNVIVAQFNNGAQTLKISLDGGNTFPISRNGVFPSGQTFFQGDDSLAFDSQGRLFWSYLTGGTP